jgi:putative addiction module component (TIGR02574 family)
MNSRVGHILDEALELAVDERSALVIALLESLEANTGEDVSDAWRQEVQSRKAALIAGETQAVPWGDARKRLQSL